MHDGTVIQGTEADFRRYTDVWICGACGTDAAEQHVTGRLILRCRGCGNWAVAPRET